MVPPVPEADTNTEADEEANEQENVEPTPDVEAEEDGSMKELEEIFLSIYANPIVSKQ